MRRTSVGLALLCALFLAPGLARAQGNPFASCQPTDIARALGMRPEPVPDQQGANRMHLSGNVSIPCNDFTLLADEVIYDDVTNIVEAIGHVTLQEKDLTIYAERAVMNRVTRLGRFFNAQGTARMAEKPAEKSLFGTLEPDVWFWGAVVAKIGPTTYQLTDGGFTTCVQPTRRWEMKLSKGTMTLDRHVVMKNMVLKVKDVPLLYLPAMYYPINKEGRSTGFLLPTYGSSSLRGTSLSNAFFLVINRSQDATFYHDWYTKTGQRLGSEYRYVGDAGSRARASFYQLSQHSEVTVNPTDTSVTSSTTSQSYRIDGDINQALPSNFRLIGRVNLFTDASTQQLYQNVSDYSQRQRSISASLSGALGRYRINVSTDRQDIFYGSTPGQRSGRAPSANISAGDRPVGRSKVYVGWFGESVYLVRQDNLDDPTTNRSLWRFDGGPGIRAPLSSLPYLTATGSASYRVTHWLESYDPLTGEQVPVALTRQLLTLSAQVVGPVFSRVFQTPDNGYADRFKHLIEPSFGIQRTSPFLDFNRVVKNDYTVDSLTGGTTKIDYKLTNRLMARRKNKNAAPGAPGIAREILSVDIGQTYYSDSLATSYDPNYQSSTAAPTPTNFTPVQMNATARPTDETSAQFRMEIDAQYRAIRTLGASGTLQSPHALVTAGWSKRQVIPGLAGFEADRADHFLNATTTLKATDNRLGGTYSLNFDIKDGHFLQQRIVAYYNSQCCGVSFDWQVISTPLIGTQPDRRFGVSFTLAGIGSFSNPLGSFGGH
jgi:hypothetical protein